MVKVAIVKGDSPAAIVREALRLINAEEVVSRDHKVLIKPNYVVASHPSTGITTDTGVVEALIKYFKEAGVKVTHMKMGGQDLELMSYVEGGPSFAREVMGEEVGLNHLSFEVDDIHEAIDWLSSKGWRLKEGFPMEGSRGLIAFFEQIKHVTNRSDTCAFQRVENAYRKIESFYRCLSNFTVYALLFFFLFNYCHQCFFTNTSNMTYMLNQHFARHTQSSFWSNRAVCPNFENQTIIIGTLPNTCRGYIPIYSFYRAK